VTGPRTVTIDVVYGPKTVEVDWDTGGTKSHQSVPVPLGALYSDEARVIRDRAPGVGKTFSYWEFSPENAKFEKVEIKTVGPTHYKRDGKSHSATLTELKTDGAVNRWFTDQAGQVVRREYTMGMSDQLEPKQIAMAMPAHAATPDMMALDALTIDKPIFDGIHLHELKVQFRGTDLSKIPSDAGQVVQKVGDSWIVDVHPPRIADLPRESIAEAAVGQERWTRPSLFIPSSDPQLTELAHQIVGKKDVLDATFAIMHYVNGIMTPDMGVGVAQDALVVLRTKQGKCTDYAILTTALLRAAGIPARLESGLVTELGTFYYHAWCAVWDGKRWIGVDSVIDDQQFSACHIRLAQGDAETAFDFAVIDPAKTKLHLLHAAR
jgi:hypothetical protein